VTLIYAQGSCVLRYPKSDRACSVGWNRRCRGLASALRILPPRFVVNRSPSSRRPWVAADEYFTAVCWRRCLIRVGLLSCLPPSGFVRDRMLNFRVVGPREGTGLSRRHLMIPDRRRAPGEHGIPPGAGPCYRDGSISAAERLLGVTRPVAVRGGRRDRTWQKKQRNCCGGGATWRLSRRLRQLECAR
jgi:hypothetical protein